MDKVTLDPWTAIRQLAARYTEARLEKIAQELLLDIDKNTSCSR